MGKKLVILIGCFVVAGLGVVHAAPVQMVGSQSAQVMKPENSQHLWYNEEYTLSIGAHYDWLSERELEDGVDAEMNSYVGKLSLDYKDRLSIYATLGQTSDASFKEKGAANTYEFFLKDSSIWGVGVAVKLLTVEDIGIDLIGDANYRQADGMEVERFTINGITQSITPGLSREADWKEWQVALGISKTFDKFTPYAGVKYSDVDAEATTTYSGTTVHSADVGADNNVGVFVGVTIAPLEGLSFDIQGRFIDEEAVTVSANYKF
jgi:hypothetical protein